MTVYLPCASPLVERARALYRESERSPGHEAKALYFNREAWAEWLQDPESRVRRSLWWDERDAWRWFKHPQEPERPYLCHLVGFPVFLDERQTEKIRVRYADGTVAPLK